ncbi:hypothetical protein B0H14DRAFT_3457685 [Mycena olivaceomarginata]|nr:hypothetical protein B0H14DRAFT_3457685 [Mycena olivaceomarginata]
MSNDTQKTGYQLVKNKGQWVKHTKFWKHDGSIVIRVDNRTIYKVHRSMLQELSPVMDSIFSIPDGKAVGDSTREGEEIDFIERNGLALGSDVAVLERICTNLLKLVHKVEVAKDHAIGLLQTIDIPPSRRLQLAGKFGITQAIGLKDIHATILMDRALVISGLTEQCRVDMVQHIVANIQFAHTDIIPACAENIVEYYRNM